jgi:hypothetical protein
MFNRIAHHLSANRNAVFASGVAMPCHSFVAVALPRPTAAGVTVLEMAVQAARVQVAAKRRLRAYFNVGQADYLWN